MDIEQEIVANLPGSPVEEHPVLPLWNNGGTTGTGAGAP